MKGSMKEEDVPTKKQHQFTRRTLFGRKRIKKTKQMLKWGWGGGSEIVCETWEEGE